MMQRRNLLLTIILCVAAWSSSVAQTFSYQEQNDDRTEFGISAGLNVGATTPVPKPKAVDKIYAWNAHMNISLKGWMSYRVPESDRWAFTSGLEFEKKGMYACTHVTKLICTMPGSSGYSTYTGDNSCEFNNFYLTLPIMGSYISPNNRFRMHAGFFVSYLMQHSFKVTLDGDGLLDDKVPAKGQLMDFDFSDQLNSFDMGLRVGFDYYLRNRIGISAQVNMSLEPTVKQSFQMMPMNLYNAYAFVGVTYRLSN